MNSRKSAGFTLAFLASEKLNIPDNNFYAALRNENLTNPKLSDLAKNDDIMN